MVARRRSPPAPLPIMGEGAWGNPTCQSTSWSNRGLVELVPLCRRGTPLPLLGEGPGVSAVFFPFISPAALIGRRPGLPSFSASQCLQHCQSRPPGPPSGPRRQHHPSACAQLRSRGSRESRRHAHTTPDSLLTTPADHHFALRAVHGDL